MVVRRTSYNSLRMLRKSNRSVTCSAIVVSLMNAVFVVLPNGNPTESAGRADRAYWTHSWEAEIPAGYLPPPYSSHTDPTLSGRSRFQSVPFGRSFRQIPPAPDDCSH